MLDFRFFRLRPEDHSHLIASVGGPAGGLLWASRLQMASEADVDSDMCEDVLGAPQIPQPDRFESLDDDDVQDLQEDICLSQEVDTEKTAVPSDACDAGVASGGRGAAPAPGK